MRFAVKMILLLLAGIGVLSYGYQHTFEVDLSCGTKEMRPGDSCAEWGNGNSASYTYAEWVTEQEKRADTRRLQVLGIGWVLIGLIPVSGLVKWRSAHAKADVGGRRALAERHGWQYLPDGPDGTTEEGKRRPLSVLGVHDGLPFQAADVDVPAKGGTVHYTIVIVAMPAPVRDVQAGEGTITSPPDLAAVARVPEVAAAAKALLDRRWVLSGQQLTVIAHPITDRKSDAKLEPLILNAVRLAKALPAEVYATAPA